MGRLDLCLNCLRSGASQIEIGPEKGSQRDPWREKVSLCTTCGDALINGRFDILAERFASERVVTRRTDAAE